jgi:hypothetical protein
LLAKAPIIPADGLRTSELSAPKAPAMRQVQMNDFYVTGFRYCEVAKELTSLVAGAKLTLRSE